MMTRVLRECGEYERVSSERLFCMVVEFKLRHARAKPCPVLNQFYASTKVSRLLGKRNTRQYTMRAWMTNMRLEVDLSRRESNKT
jgi:hypothetical protein